MYGFRRYIAAQGPIDASIVDFFDMISAFQITSIVCTAIDNEAGRVTKFSLQIYLTSYSILVFLDEISSLLA